MSAEHKSPPDVPSVRRALVILVSTMMLVGAPAPMMASDPVEPGGTPTPEARDSEDTRAEAKWTYMVYMSADNNLEDEAVLNVNQMEMVGSTSDINIVVQLDRSPEYDDTNGNWSGTRRYLVTSDTDPDLINSDMLQDMGEVDMGKGDSLRDFVAWTVASYPASRYYLDVWGHGGGWRDGTCNDFTSGTAIDTRELGRALAQAEARTNVTLDGLGFDQCLMAQLEVFYEIKQHADVLVGAETLIPSEGYNYTRVMSALAADPGMDARSLAEVLVTAFFDEYGHDNERAHSAVDAEELDARLAPSVTWLAQLLVGKAGTYFDEMELARDRTQTYSTTDYIDLGNFTEQMLALLPENETGMRRALDQVRENVTSSVIAEDHGTGRGGSTGLSFYFPDYGMASSYPRIDFGREQAWDQFLSAHFNRRDRPNTPPLVTVDSPLPGSVVGLEFGVSGAASDLDGNVTGIQLKFDRRPWRTVAGKDGWSVNVSTEGLRPGPHRVTVRSVDDGGAYSREVQFPVMVESRGLNLSVDPPSVRVHPGGLASTTLNVSTFGEEGGIVTLEVMSAPSDWTVELPFERRRVEAASTVEGDLTVAVDGRSAHGDYHVLLRAAMSDAPLIQAFTVLDVNVTFQRPDVSVGPVAFDPPEPSIGEDVNISITVSNIGLAPAEDFDVDVLHVLEYNGSETTEPFFRYHVDLLGVGGTIQRTLPWSAAMHRHTFLVRADPDGNLTELDRVNNVGTGSILLEGYSVDLSISRDNIETEPGAVETIDIRATNKGNLAGVLQLLLVNSTLGWEVVFNQSAFFLQPMQAATTQMHVRVPLDITGGTGEAITIRLRSFEEVGRFEDATISLLYPETFDLDLSQDAQNGLVPPLGTTSFNLSVTNKGNGYENYTLEYLRQSEHLFVSAVNDTTELAPGCSTQLEVFVSSLGTEVGGQTFPVTVKVRSMDDPTTLGTVWFNVTVMRAFFVTAEFEQDLVETLPGASVHVNLSVTSTGNYPVPIEVTLAEPGGLTEPGTLANHTIPAGSEKTLDMTIPVKKKALMGDYDLTVSVREVGGPENSTTAEVIIRVLRLDDSSLSIKGTEEGNLSPAGTWTFTVLLRNLGNHPETYLINLSSMPDYINASFRLGGGQWSPLQDRGFLGKISTTVPAFDEREIGIRLAMQPGTSDGPDSLMVVVTATPTNATGAPVNAVVDVPLSTPDREDLELDLLWLGLVAVALVAIAISVLVMAGRLRS